MRVSRIHRLLRLVTLLQREGSFSVGDLAEELQVSRRTVFRDLNMLEMAHIPYYYDRDRGGYRLNRRFFLPPVNLDLPEALSLMMLAVRQRPSAPMPEMVHAGRAAMKLECMLPGPVREHIGSVLEHIDYRPTPAARHEGVDDLMSRIPEAIAHRRVCRMVYISFYDRKQIRLTIRPLRLVFMHRAWYVLAWSRHFGEIRTFKLSRIKQLDVDPERTFDTPDPADAATHFGEAWSMIREGRIHNVHLLFDADVAGSVAEVQWHSSQKIEWRDDGSVDFRARVDGLGEIAAWILGYGDKVRVVKPAALARKVAATAERMMARYAKGGE